MKTFNSFLSKRNLFHFSFFIQAILFLPASVCCQQCSELFISEVMFGIDDPITGKTSQAVELYNPTEKDIDLSGYKILLKNSLGSTVTIELTGEIESDATFVIGNYLSLPPIFTNNTFNSAPDFFSANLDFEDKVVLRFGKSGVGILDEIGSEGPAIDLEDIDINQLNDPEYVESLHINLGSLKYLDIRRDGLIQEGAPAFSEGKFFSEWALFPGIEYGNLGLHESACFNVLLSFYSADPLMPEEHYLEGTSDHYTTVVITEALPIDITIDINCTYIPQQFTGPILPEATVGIDYIKNPLFSDFHTWPAFQNSRDYLMITEVALDAIEEGEERGTCQLSVIDAGNIPVIVSTTKRFFDFIIYEPLNPTKNISLANFKIFPTLVGPSNKFIQWQTDELDKIISVEIIDISGRVVAQKQCSGCSEIDIPNSIERGPSYVRFNTSKGSFTKKIIKI